MKPGRKPATDRTEAERAHAAREAQRYRDKTPSEKRDVIQSRDREAQQAADNRRHERDNDKRNAKQRDHQSKNWERDEPKRKARAVARVQASATKCSSCGSTKNVERHHTDYSKPSQVTTLCSQCHGQQHQH